MANFFFQLQICISSGTHPIYYSGTAAIHHCSTHRICGPGVFLLQVEKFNGKFNVSNCLLHIYRFVLPFTNITVDSFSVSCIQV